MLPSIQHRAIKRKGAKMGTINNRLRKLEQQHYGSSRFMVLFERYPGQSLEEAKEKAGLSGTNDNDRYIAFMTAQDAGVL